MVNDERTRAWTAMWVAQDGKCYLCGDPLSSQRGPAGPHIDHDHTCCSGRDGSGMRTCAYCRRGLTCGPCNMLIGLAGEDPARLRRIAENLEAALAATGSRLASKAQQETLKFSA